MTEKKNVPDGAKTDGDAFYPNRKPAISTNREKSWKKTPVLEQFYYNMDDFTRQINSFDKIRQSVRDFPFRNRSVIIIIS